jgi:hypothetical protein
MSHELCRRIFVSCFVRWNNGFTSNLQTHFWVNSVACQVSFVIKLWTAVMFAAFLRNICAETKQSHDLHLTCGVCSLAYLCILLIPFSVEFPSFCLLIKYMYRQKIMYLFEY